MDDGTKAEIRDLIREAKLEPEHLDQVRDHLSSRYRLLSREMAGYVGGAVIAFVAAVGYLSWSSAAAGISNELSKRGVEDTLETLEEKTAAAEELANHGFPLGTIIAWHGNILCPTDKKEHAEFVVPLAEKGA